MLGLEIGDSSWAENKSPEKPPRRSGLLHVSPLGKRGAEPHGRVPLLPHIEHLLFVRHLVECFPSIIPQYPWEVRVICILLLQMGHRVFKFTQSQLCADLPPGSAGNAQKAQSGSA